MFQQETIQYTKPLFVRNRHKNLVWKGKEWSYNDYFPWAELGIPEDKVRTWFEIGMLYHNEDLEQETKVGDRLSELNYSQLGRLVKQLNYEVKKRTSSDTEFNNKKCKVSKVESKQRTLIRQWLSRNAWATDEFYLHRDTILGE